MCPFCLESVEDEIHVLFVCPVYADISLKYLGTVVIDETTLEQQCVSLLASEDNGALNLAKFVFCAGQRRQSHTAGVMATGI
ncbi:hypothetical protein BaRGS_00035347 [Batillaria attramentaria]|uniref:Reverse transcriptase zinc-binding domain-containing protein n=1 Tax=Batillaria attramentaria TaxID=370345 RepID=A0ABD0JES9_9CAEN